MKLLVEDNFQDTLLCENDEKNYYIQGVFATIGVRNKNGRVYPRRVWEPEIKKFQKKIQENSVECLGEWNHPYNPQVDPIKSVIKIVELYIDGDKVMGRAKIIDNKNNPIVGQIKALIDEGIKFGISSRGVGNVDSNNNVTEFRLITFDLVSQPSDVNAGNLKGVKESLNEEYEIVDDRIVKVDREHFDKLSENISTTTLKETIIDRIKNF